jgi:TetR/AcrR family transcriptional repressor of nem operon
MRYPPEHKERVHSRIVDVAAREFRRRGLEGVGIADLMTHAGLTHGSFYAHFKDRDALVGEATVRAAAESIDRLVRVAESAGKGREIEAMVQFYLSPEHRDDPACGCLLPALAADLSRQSEGVRDAFTQSLKSNLGKLAHFMPGGNQREKVLEAMTFMASLVGGVLLARALNDEEASRLMLDAMRTRLASRRGARKRN